MAKKIISFFLASSIKDLAYDRLVVGDFVNQLNNIYDTSDIFIKLYKCESETLDHSLKIEGSQASLDEIIKSSDMCFVIFWRKAGEVTFHELEIALEANRKFNKPKIVVYFKKLAEGESRSDEVNNVMRIIDKELKHYHREYDHIDSLKLGIVTQLMAHGFVNAALSVEDNKIVCENNSLMPVDGIPLFADNAEYTELVEKYSDAVERRKKLQNLYAADNGNLKAYRDLGRAAKECERLKADLDELTSNILDIGKSIAALTAGGKAVSRNIRRAVQCFDSGDYDGVLEALDPADIEKSVAGLDKIENNVTAERTAVVEEYRMRILALKARARWDEVHETYKKAVEQVESRPQMPQKVVFEYALFLFKQTQYVKCIEICNRLEKRLEAGGGAGIKQKAEIENLCGLAYYKTGDYKQANQRFLNCIRLLEPSAAEAGNLKCEYAEACVNLAKVYYCLDRHVQAEKLYLQALDVYGAQAENIAMLIKTVDIHMSLADLYYQTNRHREAEQLFIEALGVCQTLAQTHPLYDEYAADIGNRLAHINLAIVAHRVNDRYFKEALKTRRELLGNGKQAFYDYLERVCNTLSEQYAKHGYEEYSQKIKKCVKPLSQIKKDADVSDFSYYDKKMDFVKIEEWCAQALQIRLELARQNPEAYEGDVAQSYKIFAEFYMQKGELDKAENNLAKSLEIQKRLISFNRGGANAALAAAYCSFASLYARKNNFERAEKMYISALDIYRSLSFLNELARTYNYLGRLYIQFGKDREAVSSLYNSIELYTELYRKSPGAYIDRVINAVADALHALCPQEEKALMSGLLL